MDNRKYRLNDDKELEVYQKDLPRYNRFVNRVYNFLDSLAVGEVVAVADVTNDSNIDVFIKVVCTYILYRNPHNTEDSYIIFNEDYSKITREPGIEFRKIYHNNFYEGK